MTNPLRSILLGLGLAVLPASGSDRPNIILMMADDLGFSDLGCYGSEIPTPNLDALARGGIRYTDFHNTSRCCPSRASLLAGLYSHQAGIGEMNGAEKGPGYLGQLRGDFPIIPELLKRVGYSTAMVGKWHLTRSKTIDAGPNGSWPRQRGFDRFYGTMEGAKNYFTPKWLFDDNKEIKEFDEEFFYTDAITTKAAGYIRDQPEGKPLFMYVAFYAPHFPLQAPAAAIDRFRGKYRVGWDELRNDRLRRQMAERVVPEGTQLSDRTPGIPAWDELSAEQQDRMDLRMATYAAQVHLLDQGVGRILAALRRTGRLDNTLILFLSDNGGTDSGGPWGRGNQATVGRPEAEVHTTYGAGWANLSNTPYRQFKAKTHQGGVMSPLIVHWPARLKAGGVVLGGIRHIIDILPTCLIAGGYNEDQYQLEGSSLLDGVSPDRSVFFEHFRSQAVRSGNLKLVRKHSRDPWELYNLADDRTERIDLSPDRSRTVATLSQKWNDWARRCLVVPREAISHKAVRSASLKGIVIDDDQTTRTGKWSQGDRLPGFVGRGYRWSKDPKASMRFTSEKLVAGNYEVRLAYRAHSNRGRSVPVTVKVGQVRQQLKIDMTQTPKIADTTVSLGMYRLDAAGVIEVTVSAKDAGGNTTADAVEIVLVK